MQILNFVYESVKTKLYQNSMVTGREIGNGIICWTLLESSNQLSSAHGHGRWGRCPSHSPSGHHKIGKCMTLIPSLTFTELWVVSVSICNLCDMPAGNAYPSGHLVPSPFLDLLVLHLLRPDSSNLSCLYSTFPLEYPLVLSRFCLLGLSDILLIYRCTCRLSRQLDKSPAKGVAKDVLYLTIYLDATTATLIMVREELNPARERGQKESESWLSEDATDKTQWSWMRLQK